MTSQSLLAIVVRCLAFVGIGLLRVMSIPVGCVLWVIDKLPRRRRKARHHTLQQTDQYHRHIRRVNTDDIPLGHIALILIAAVLVMIWVLF